MPLKAGKSQKVISENISEFHGGKTYAATKAKFGKEKADKQAVAVAMSNARGYASGGRLMAEGGNAAWSRITLPPDQEASFQRDFRASPFFNEFVSRYKEEPDLDGDYDYRLWWQDGMNATRVDDGTLHGPSKTKDGRWLKSPDHPTHWKQEYMERYGVDPDQIGATNIEDAPKSGDDAMRRARQYAAGGASRVPGPSFFQRDANRALSRQSGLIRSVVPGRTDKHNMRVASGSYIIPADVVSHLGQSNTLAGAKFLKRKFGGGGGVLQFAGGGEVPMPVDIVTAGGEYVLSPDQVAAVGKGDLKKGHDTLDRMVLDTRKHHIKTLRKLAPPKRS